MPVYMWWTKKSLCSILSCQKWLGIESIGGVTNYDDDYYYSNWKDQFRSLESAARRQYVLTDWLMPAYMAVRRSSTWISNNRTNTNENKRNPKDYNGVCVKQQPPPFYYICLVMVGGWCWFGMREKYCWLINWQISQANRVMKCDDDMYDDEAI